MSKPDENRFLVIAEGDLEFLFDHGEFPETITGHSEKVVVIMTQDWCSQWAAMKEYLPEFAENVSIFVLEYNRHTQFARILDFKENTFGNQAVPYLRFYAQGVLVSESNYLPKNSFSVLAGKTESDQKKTAYNLVKGN